MMVTWSFTSLAALAAALAAPAPAQDNSQQAQLGVTATVVRPAEIITFSAPTGDAVALIRNAEAIDVVADGGTVRRRGGETTILLSTGSGSVTVTFVF